MSAGMGAGAVCSSIEDAEAKESDASTPVSASMDMSDSTEMQLPAVRIHGREQVNTLNTNTTRLDIGRMPDTVRETPQTITVVPEKIIEQQRIFTLDQALANVPGITMSAGEGNGGMNGNQFRIRGQQARGDIYEDGLRDFGNYVRDVYNTQSVEVVKGPSGEYFGAGNVGGVINQTLKKAHEGNVVSADQSFGSGMLYRGTADANYQIGAHTALRVNGMYNKQMIADRNNVRTDRYGAAADLGFGLGTKTTWHLNYQWLGSRGRPDYGVSMIRTGDVYRPITEYGLPRSTNYSRNFDRDRGNVHMVTSKFSSQIARWLTLSNSTRYSHYTRNFAATTPSACSGACAAAFLAGGNPTLPYGAGGGMAYDQAGWGVQNVSMGHSKFRTGFLRHDIRAGVDINYTKDNRAYGSYLNRSNSQSIRTPQFEYPGTEIVYPASGMRTGDFRDLGLFLADKIHLTRQLSVYGTVRWDDYAASYWSAAAAGAGTQRQNSNRFSPSASLMYEPLENTTFYFTFSQSYKPVGTDVSSLTMGRSDIGDVPVNGRDLKPQRSDLYELGGKADFLDKRLGVTAAIFQIEQNNSFTYDDDGNILVGFQDAGSGRRIRGLEVSASGQITRDWEIYGSYAYMGGKVTNSRNYQDRKAPQLPDNSLSVWSTYDLSRLVLKPQQGSLKAGGGVQYASGYWANEANTGRMPANISVNAMLSYDYARYHMQFNANNLTNHLNYGSAFSTGRAVPTSGRTFLGSIGVRF
ncbi:TonB-dependent receptor [Swaminathania salitolerans]|nr:TonB-dependent siderophore receptor [Swaminathania salitolerans]